jgi:hypothetical protein
MEEKGTQAVISILQIIGSDRIEYTNIDFPSLFPLIFITL